MNPDFDRVIDPAFDPRIAEWLEADPDRAPGETIETILAALPSVPQRHALRLPWRSPDMFTPARVAVAAVIGVLLVGGAFLAFQRPSQSNIGGPGPSASAPPSSTAPPSPSTAPSEAAPSGASDYSYLPGRILAEHLGNAIDGSEYPTADYNPDRRRLYLMDPKTMTGATSTEFLPGQPETGKSAADVSSDGTKVVFQDWATPTKIYEADLDGTGFHQIPVDCTCSLLYPDYDPTATRIVYVRVQGSQSWLEIRDLASGQTTKLDKTVSSSTDDVPEQPAWSPDGKTIAFSSLRWGGGNDPVVGTVRYGDVPPTSGKISLVDIATGAVTDVSLPPNQLPGDVNWSPDSRSLLFTSGPGSTTGSNGGMPEGGGARRINVDGTGFEALSGWGGPQYLPDGVHILVQDNVFYVMNADQTGYLPVKVGGMDLSDLPQGFTYIGHWVQTP
jgi:Tol biopolymer transport system component